MSVKDEIHNRSGEETREQYSSQDIFHDKYLSQSVHLKEGLSKASTDGNI